MLSNLGLGILAVAYFAWLALWIVSFFHSIQYQRWGWLASLILFPPIALGYPVVMREIRREKALGRKAARAKARRERETRNELAELRREVARLGGRVSGS